MNLDDIISAAKAAEEEMSDVSDADVDAVTGTLGVSEMTLWHWNNYMSPNELSVRSCEIRTL